jgi:hypothetical protein
MKRIACLSFAVVVLAALAGTFAFAQSDSLGDYARSVRKDKKPTPAKQFDNDNLPRNDKLSVVGPADTGSDAQAGPASQTADASNANATSNGPSAESADKPKEASPADSKAADAQAEKQKLWDDWQKKVAHQKDKIDLLSRELDVMQREYKLRAAAMYADAGNRLRNSAAWDKEDAQYKQQLAEKQKMVDTAKQELEDLQEQAHRAGVPSSKTE